MATYFLLLIALLSIFSLSSTSLAQQDSSENQSSTDPIAERYDWPLFVYNFGGLKKFPIHKQVELLHAYGYAGMAISVETIAKLDELRQYQEAANALQDFKINTAFYRFNYSQENGISEEWMSIIDHLAGTGTDLWLIFGRMRDGYTPEFIEQQLRAVSDYAALKQVKVTLYPHSGDTFPTAEAALEYVAKIDSPYLDLAVHSCHEIRAGNGDRIEAVIDAVKEHLGYVTLAGSDQIPNDTNQSEWEYSTLKPLYRGNYDLTRIIKKLGMIGYEGSIGFINHRIRETPEVYLPQSIETYDNWLQEEISAFSKNPFDAPDQCVWHAESRSWFVSNLGGGISLARDGYGWITRLDEHGKVIDPVWLGFIENMHAPSGMLIHGNYLYACDRDGVHQIDIAKGTVSNYYPIPDNQFINDIAVAANGDLYVSDFFANRIYRLAHDNRKVEVWLETDALETPDGLYIDGNHLIVGSWGVLSEPGTFKTSKLGSLLKIDLQTKGISILSPEAGNLEGLTKAGDYFYVTDWASGKLLKIHSKSGAVTEYITGLRNPTDPGYAEELGVISFPQHTGDQVLFHKLPH